MSRSNLISKLIALTGDKSWRYTKAQDWELQMVYSMIMGTKQKTKIAA
jgi:hypothetical protein